MRRLLSQMAVIRRGGMLLMLILLGGLLPTQAGAHVDVNINIGPPAPIIVESAPQMLFLPEPGVYVAVGIPYDVFFIGGRYYYFHGDHWFWGPGYRGPWTYVEYRGLPPGLRKYKVVRLREYREHEYKVYRVQGRNFTGKHFYAAGGHDDRDDDRDGGRGRGKGGRGKGKKH